jgi:hypothetical protein
VQPASSYSFKPFRYLSESGPIVSVYSGSSERRLKLLHDGVVGEYVTWLTLGAAAMTGLLALLTR